MQTSPLDAAAYHARSKHHLGRYARGPEGLDWDHQPDPFRRFAGSPVTPLPLRARGLTTDYAELFNPARPPAALSLDNLGAFCELAMGLSAWKVYGESRWSLRCNPSSGNLHPSEGYLVLPPLDGLDGGVYHYQSHDHALEQRCRAETSAALAEGGFLVGLSSALWREAWKYGERAFRYGQLDIGHLLGALRYAAACLGWRVTLCAAWCDPDIATALGLAREADFGAAEREDPELMLAVHTSEAFVPPAPEALNPLLAEGRWSGQANVLSAEHEFRWPVLDQATQACRRPRPLPAADWSGPEAPLLQPDYLHERNASALIRQRRSAQAYDGATPLPLDAFCRLLDALLPRPQQPPFDLWPLPARVHPVLFVHRVEGLDAGLYALPRSAAGEALMRQAMNPQFAWERVASLPEHLPLARLVKARCGNAAATLSCHQPIAADGAFAVAMLAEFDEALRAGDWTYRLLLWEAGLLGQSLYLEAEASGRRGTGIGCFFDDKVHEICGLQDSRLQDVYHFTVGAPQVDGRLVTLPPYSHLENR